MKNFNSNRSDLCLKLWLLLSQLGLCIPLQGDYAPAWTDESYPWQFDQNDQIEQPIDYNNSYNQNWTTPEQDWQPAPYSDNYSIHSTYDYQPYIAPQTQPEPFVAQVDIPAPVEAPIAPIEQRIHETPAHQLHEVIAPLSTEHQTLPPTQETHVLPPLVQPEAPVVKQQPLLPTPAPAVREEPAKSIPISPGQRVITPQTPAPEETPAPQPQPVKSEPESTAPLTVGPVNFNNLAIIEYIRFISRITEKNFVFEDEDLQFNVTIISKEPTTVENLMAALLQELRIRDLSIIEQGNTLIIHRNPRIRSPGHIIPSNGTSKKNDADLVTRVFRLNTLDPTKASEIIKPLLSDDALVEVLRDTNNLVITDLTSNVNKISELIDDLDAPNSGATVGQYVVRNGFVDSLVELATRIILPIAQGNPFVLVPHGASNSVYIVSNPFIVEKALAILQNLDINDGKTKVFSLDKLKPRSFDQPAENLSGGISSTPPPPSSQSPEFLFGPGGMVSRPPSVLNEASEFLPGGISAGPKWSQELPTGHIERTLFFIYKLKYRRGDQIEISLRKIANSLMATGVANIDLVSAINSVQWIESSNSLIFTGTITALEKIKDLMLEVDTPLRQVFIECLILDTTLGDALTYGVDWGVVFGGGQTAGGETFLNDPNTPGTEGFNVIESLIPNIPSPINVATSLIPMLRNTGLNMGIIGRHLTHNGTQFSTISALVRALHTDSKAEVLMTPKIITEDNVTAEIFVGETDRYKTQSISNDQGSVITNNFQFIDVGTMLRVTPLIGNNGVITLDIIQEVTRPSPTANTGGSNFANDVNLVTVLFKNRTTTRIHVPNGFFVIMSGMIHTVESSYVNQIPCLGCIPIIGGAGKLENKTLDKKNLMIFIRPLIVDTESELEEITKRQQDVYRSKCKSRRKWNYEVDEALDFLNLKSTDLDEMSPCYYMK